MPSNRTTSREQHRMIIFDTIAPDGTRERLRFETQAEADAAGPRAGPEDQHREAGHSIYWGVITRSANRGAPDA